MVIKSMMEMTMVGLMMVSVTCVASMKMRMLMDMLALMM